MSGQMTFQLIDTHTPYVHKITQLSQSDNSHNTLHNHYPHEQYALNEK